MSKKKILWVVYDFVQAGGQRYVYEICKALDKDKYEIDILKVASMNHDKNWENEFYYEPTIKLGCKVILLEELFKPVIESKIKKIKNRFLRHLKLNSIPHRNTTGKILELFFNNYDAINFSGVSVYQIACINNNLHPLNAFIHILTFSFQDQQMYKAYNKELSYKFISPVTPSAVKSDLRDFTNYTFQYFPLCFETVPYEIERKEVKTKFRIAIFTRLSTMKPLDPFFYTLKILVEQGLDVELFIYGAGNPVELGLVKQLQYLYLADHVKFMGHTESIPDTLKQDSPDLFWFQSANQEPGGYAAFEISMSGLPQLFYDFMDSGEKREIGEVFPSFTQLLSFAAFTKEVLQNTKIQNDLGQAQRAYTLDHYSIKNHIHILDNLFSGN